VSTLREHLKSARGSILLETTRELTVFGALGSVAFSGARMSYVVKTRFVADSVLDNIIKNQI
jgi:hypothetical protein